MSRNIVIIIILVAAVLVIGLMHKGNKNRPVDNGASVISGSQYSEEARGVVEAFGERLKMVTLTAPKAQVIAAIDEQYATFVAPELLAQWKVNPELAPGKTVSSPWPDRIAVQSVTSEANSMILVEGMVIEVTSVEADRGGIAASYPVRIELQKRNGKFLIIKFEKGPYVSSGKVTEIEGKFSCLPHKNANGPTTLECAYGLFADSSQYYALDVSLIPVAQVAELESSGGRFRITGTVTPREALSSSHWFIYDMVGVIQVKNIQKI